MSVALYMDVHIHSGITAALRVREVDVLTAQQDQADRMEDDRLLDRATELGRVVFTNDTDFLAIAHHRQDAGVPHAGVIFAPQNAPIGRIITSLELCAEACEPSDFQDAVTYIPF